MRSGIKSHKAFSDHVVILSWYDLSRAFLCIKDRHAPPRQLSFVFQSFDPSQNNTTVYQPSRWFVSDSCQVYSNDMSLNTPAAGQFVPVINPEAVSYVDRDLLFNYSTSTVDMPTGYKHRQYRLFGYNLPWYASPKIQLGIVAFVCFVCPSMFNALTGMGGGGKKDSTLANNVVSTKPQRGISIVTGHRTQLCIAHLLSLASLGEQLSTPQC